MKKPLHIPQDTLDRQAAAANPHNSVWVSANAGSGKTHVLAQRVIRLLLGNTEPSKILCLTYTRAAAANMSNRVFKELAAWTALSDDALANEITKLEGERPSAAKLKLARRLFARALETPGGLKIQTIHAFCEAVLHQFPLEANIAAHFQLLDGQMEAALFTEARRDLISGAAGGNDPSLAEAFADVLERGGEWGLDQLLDEIVAKRVRLRQFVDQLGPDEDGHYQQLYAEFGLDPTEDAAAIAASIWTLPGLSPDEFSEFHDAANAVGASSILKNILPDATAGFHERDPVRRMDLLIKGLLKKDGGAYAASAFVKALVARLPDIYERYVQAANVLSAARNRLALLSMVQATEAMVVIADRLIARYERLKTSRGFLDFGDLITRTVRLLSRDDVGPWVQFKLDRGIDHILLDEAQDTSPDQWGVVERLAGEFFVGASARDDVRRTVFAVGDEKQSIYSFQGADPTSFAESGRRFERTIVNAERVFRSVPLTLSFRSTQDILHAVDLVFDEAETRRGLSEFKTTHGAVRHGDPGYVEIWPSIAAEAQEEKDDWRVPVDHLKAPAIELAEQIARTIKGWIDSKAVLEGQNRLIAPGDVLVLVRKRDKFVHALSRALKNLHVPVAGADRLRLGGHIAVQDLLALGRFLLMSEDDLALAGVLKSPIFGLSEDELFDVAGRRPKGQPLIAALREAAARHRNLADITERLDRWRHAAAFQQPFEFYSGILQRDGARALMIARLGAEAGDMLDEFLSFCLAYEAPGLPGLEALISALESSGPEIKREMDQTRGEVRIMTVHASKGLEAPIVFLVDSGSAPVSASHLPRLMPFHGKAALAGLDGFLWNAGADANNAVASGIAEHLKNLADDEYRRLLYVGLTRAEDRLIVCGYHGKTKQQERSWHAIVTRALLPESKIVAHPITGEDVLRYRSTPFDETSVKVEDIAKAAEHRHDDLPVLGQTPSPPALPRPLTPSGAAAMIEPVTVEATLTLSPVLEVQAGVSPAIQRGLIVHKLMQVLPALGSAEREATALRYIAHAAPEWNADQREAAWRSVRAVLDDPTFAPLFASGSRAEISISGTINVRGRDRAVSGQIDRLAVNANEVLIVDYKTNRVAPDNASDAPEAYILQMALYAELLKPLYPGRQIRAALLYTEIPRLIELPQDLLRTTLARLTAS